MDTQRLAGIAFLLSFGGLILTAGLFAIVYFDLVPDASYLPVGIAVPVFQVPALAMAIIARRRPLGRAALALSASILVSVTTVLLLVVPARVTRDFEQDVTEAQAEVRIPSDELVTEELPECPELGATSRTNPKEALPACLTDITTRSCVST